MTYAPVIESFDCESVVKCIRFYDTSLPATARHVRAVTELVLNLKVKR